MAKSKEKYRDLSVTGVDPWEIKKELSAPERAAKMKFLFNEIIAKIEGYKFTCEAGLLENCVDWKELKELVEKIK